MPGRTLQIEREDEGQCRPFVFLNHKLYIGLPVHVRTRFNPGCNAAIVTAIFPNGVVNLYWVGGSEVTSVPYQNPDPNDPVGRSWHFITTGSEGYGLL